MSEPNIHIEFSPKRDQYEFYFKKAAHNILNQLVAKPIEFEEISKEEFIVQPCFILSWEAAQFFMKELWRGGVKIKNICYQEMSKKEKNRLLKDLKESIDILECM